MVNGKKPPTLLPKASKFEFVPDLFSCIITMENGMDVREARRQAEVAVSISYCTREITPTICGMLTVHVENNGMVTISNGNDKHVHVLPEEYVAGKKMSEFYADMSKTAFTEMVWTIIRMSGNLIDEGSVN